MTKNKEDFLSLLLVDDEPDILKKMSFYLKEQGHQVQLACNGQEAWGLLQKKPVDIVITDLRMPEKNGMELLRDVKTEYPETEVIILTGHGDMEAAVEALRYGALDFLNKPVKFGQLEGALLRSKSFLKTRKENLQLKAQYRQSALEKSLEDIKGKSTQIQKVKELIQKASEYDTTVLITGESGTGKELVARAIHYGSQRKEKPFVTVNCSAIPENLVESEFFGHRKGSFTGAHENKTGFFQAAHGGSIFLDEIGDMPLNAQMKLLRVLEEKKIKPIGYRYDISIDVRTIAATNQNLEEMIIKQSFRQDLYYRLNVFPIYVPPLRERVDDIPLIVEYLVDELATTLRKKIDHVEDKVYDHLKKYPFPGNVRELRNMVERALILCSGSSLAWKDFQDRISPITPMIEKDGPTSLNIREHERHLIKKALEQTSQNRHQAAKLLGISWSTLDRKMKQDNPGD